MYYMYVCTYVGMYVRTFICMYILLLLLTAIELSLGGSSPTLVQIKQIRINIHKRNSTQNSTNNINNNKHGKYKYTY